MNKEILMQMWREECNGGAVKKRAGSAFRRLDAGNVAFELTPETISAQRISPRGKVVFPITRDEYASLVSEFENS